MLLYLDETERARSARELPADVLAVVRFGGGPAPIESGPWLTVAAPNPALAGGPKDEVWPATGRVLRIELEGAAAAADGRFLFASVETGSAEGPGIESAAFDVYRRLLSGVARAGYAHVIRVWNYVPNIHEAAGGIDRYMRFCKGRSDAFAAQFGPGFPERLPAASAVGSPGDTLVVHLLAGREAGRHVENPRQIAAYRYPERYGPKSPSFARGTVTSDGVVLVSGTASIVGHESAFPGDPARQTEETMRNIEAVLDAAEVPGKRCALGPRLQSLRVYVRHPEHFETIRAAIAAYAGCAVPTAWLQAQICREELLVEIEATALSAPRVAPGGACA